MRRTAQPLARTAVALLLAAAAAPAAPAHAQAQKRPLAIEDFDHWKSIDGERLSKDGRWLAYTLTPQVGEGVVVVRDADGQAEYRHTRGFIGRPNQRPGADRNNLWRAPAAQFTADARHLLFTIEPTREVYEAAQRSKKKDAPRPTSSLGILRTADGSVEVVERVKSFRAPEDSGRWLAYLLEPDTTQKAQEESDSAAAPAAAAEPGEEPRPVADSASTADKKKKTYGSTLVIRDLESGAEARVEDVVAYAFDDAGRRLAYTVSSKDSTSDGAWLRELEGGATQALLSGEGDYKELTFDDAGRQLAFVSNRDDYASENPRFTLYHATVDRPSARAIVTSATLADTLVVADRMVGFTEDGRVLRFGVRRPPLDSIPADSLADKAVFD
ncbi:MAG TPA: hypothetical protein VMK65_07880, partial [Longimicrobiales bacterium]|nr:hypothetical protein [Longimicrobiales bacterium]